MSEISVSQNQILWEIPKGTSASIALNKTDGWAMYDEIKMDFKNTKRIDADPILTLTVGSGLTITGTRLYISLTYGQVAAFKNTTIHADVKLRIGTDVIDPIPFLITIPETVTKIS